MTGRRAAAPLARTLSAAAFAAALLLGSCSGSPPQIARVSAQLIYGREPVGGDITEELALFVVPEDKDGLDDLEFLHVISDRAELYWTVPADSWTRVRGQNEEWVGSARLAMPSGERFPRGTFRVLLYDLSGDSDEQTFSLPPDPPDTASLPFPLATVAGGRIALSGRTDWYTVLVYTAADAYVRSFAVQAAGIDLESVRRSDTRLRGGFKFRVYAFWPPESVGLLSGPWDAE